LRNTAAKPAGRWSGAAAAPSSSRTVLVTLGSPPTLAVESIVASAVNKALEAVLKEVGEGRKLSAEDPVALTLGLFREIKK